MAEFLAFNAFFRGAGPQGSAIAIADEALGRVGLTPVDPAPALPRRSYSVGAGPAWAMNFRLAEPWSCVELFLGADALRESSGSFTAEALKLLCESLGVRLGRTFDEGGHGVVKEQELEGALEFIDWFQYLDRHLTDRWGAAVLAAGPFDQVIRTQSGGTVLLLGESVGSELRSRRAAAEYLGIKLRPLYGRNPKDGSRIELPWR